MEETSTFVKDKQTLGNLGGNLGTEALNCKMKSVNSVNTVRYLLN